MRATDYIATASQIGLNERLDAKALGLSQYGSFDDGEDRAKTNRAKDFEFQFWRLIYKNIV